MGQLSSNYSLVVNEGFAEVVFLCTNDFKEHAVLMFPHGNFRMSGQLGKTSRRENFSIFLKESLTYKIGDGEAATFKISTETMHKKYFNELLDSKQIIDVASFRAAHPDVKLRQYSLVQFEDTQSKLVSIRTVMAYNGVDNILDEKDVTVCGMYKTTLPQNEVVIDPKSIGLTPYQILTKFLPEITRAAFKISDALKDYNKISQENLSVQREILAEMKKSKKDKDA